MKKDLGKKLQGMGKSSLVITGLLSLMYVVKGFELKEWDPKIQIKKSFEMDNERLEKKKKLVNYKQALFDYVDIDSNGVSKKEQYTLDSLMGIESENKNYVPSYEDWEKAYGKISF